MTGAEYIAGGGSTCPYCRESGALEATGSLDMLDGIEMLARITCTACGASFHDVYRLAGYAPADE